MKVTERWEMAFAAMSALLGEPLDAIEVALGDSATHAAELLAVLRSGSRRERALAIARTVSRVVVAVEASEARMTSRARIIAGPQAASARPLLSMEPSLAHRRRIAREELEARLMAERILEEAKIQAHVVLERARIEACEVAAKAARHGESEGHSQAMAAWLSVRQREHVELDRQTDRIVAIAVALAERLLGAALRMDPSYAVTMARAVLAEARGARRAIIDAHPLDAAELRQQLTTAGFELQSVEVREDAALTRGDLRLHTDLGTIDARLAPRFERLASALRDVLK